MRFIKGRTWEGEAGTRAGKMDLPPCLKAATYPRNSKPGQTQSADGRLQIVSALTLPLLLWAGTDFLPILLRASVFFDSCADPRTDLAAEVVFPKASPPLFLLWLALGNGGRENQLLVIPKCNIKCNSTMQHQLHRYQIILKLLVCQIPVFISVLMK